MNSEKLETPELAAVEVIEDSEDLSRSEVILKGALGVGALYGALSVGPWVRRALAASGGGDVGILNFALTLEYLEATFYREALSRAKAKGDLKQLIQLIGKDEQQPSTPSRGRSGNWAASPSPSRSSTSNTTTPPAS